MFTDTIEKILREHCTPTVIRQIENGASTTELWRIFEKGGFLDLMVTESEGGAGLTLAEMFPIFLAFGRHALPLPVAQSIAARSLLRDNAMPVPGGMLTLAGVAQRLEEGEIRVPLAPFGLVAEWALINLDGALYLLDCRLATRHATGVRGSLSAGLHWPAGMTEKAISDNGEVLLAFSAALHAAAIAGAMEWMFSRTLEFCNEREQFGKPIGKFQAVQHQLSVMAERVAAAGAAAEMAFSSSAFEPDLQAAAIAKSATSMAVAQVAASAHALHGAIGITEEYDLQLYSRRLHEWRVSEGSETYWNGILGEALLARSDTSIIQFVRTVGQPPSVEPTPRK